ncbi:MAG: PIG-L deacetylase family protein [Armatimonadota bacterium]|nr:PIG-L deacetylase family protein [Armatimonadota bacterium]
MTLGWAPVVPGGRAHVLLVGAHADDIEIGCGGTILSWLAAGVHLDVTWVVFGATGVRAEEARRSAAAFLQGAASARVVVHGFRDGFFPYDAGVKEAFEALKAEVDPDVVFTHYRHDRHQDHRTVSDLTWNTFRAHAILEYEIPKYDGDFGAPNLFVPLTRELCEAKVRLLLEHFPSQATRPWFAPETFFALARLRGVEAGAHAELAEAFYARKLTLALAGGDGTTAWTASSTRQHSGVVESS